jgi:hypothetical protein
MRLSVDGVDDVVLVIGLRPGPGERRDDVGARCVELDRGEAVTGAAIEVALLQGDRS